MTPNDPSPSAATSQDTGDTGVPIDTIIQVTADYFELTPDDLKGMNTRASTNPRMIAIYLCRELTHHSIPRIAQIFGRESQSIMLADKTIKQRIQDGSGRVEEQVAAITKVILDRVQGEAPKPTPIPWHRILQVKKYARVSVIRAAWAAMSAENDPLLTDQSPLYSQATLDAAMNEGVRLRMEGR